MKWLWRILVFALLTVVTQVGGIVYLVTHIISTFWFTPGKNVFLKRNVFFMAIYFLTVFVFVPPLAGMTGRKALPVNSSCIKSQNCFTVIANRRYVNIELYDLLMEVGNDFHGLKSIELRKIVYLDANFPFFKGFPLLPHLSHDDGEKVDLCLRYRTISDSRISNEMPGIFGYGVYEEPRPGEEETTPMCKTSNPWYDASKVFGIRRTHNLEFDELETKRLIEIIARNKVAKIFIEPHLKQRLNLTSSKVRFHGCHAVRHDDHIHVEL